MYDVFYEWLLTLNISTGTANILSYALMFAAIALICYIVHVVGEFIVKRLAKLLVRHKWAEILFERKFFHHLANMLIPVVITLMERQFPSHNETANDWLIKLAQVLAALFSAFLLNSIIDAADKIYHTYEVSKAKPLRSLFQVMKVVIAAICVLVGISVLAGQNPIVMLGGIGAVAAVISFIFKDAILGFFSGIQLVGNDLIRIGDWIEMPKYNANGNVVELSITSVKVENFDRSFTSIPAYALISDAFINWRGILDSGSRRIKRAIYIDAKDIKFLDGETTTNLTQFREYVSDYLNEHPHIRHDLVALVRQLDSDGHGVPLEVYAFADTSAFEEYELIQSTIFEHLYAKIADFGLRVYQWPSEL